MQIIIAHGPAARFPQGYISATIQVAHVAPPRAVLPLSSRARAESADATPVMSFLDVRCRPIHHYDVISAARQAMVAAKPDNAAQRGPAAGKDDDDRNLRPLVKRRGEKICS